MKSTRYEPSFGIRKDCFFLKTNMGELTGLDLQVYYYYFHACQADTMER